MKLEAFSVSNYRSIRTCKKIALRDYTVLIGKNNEGKSNLLRALYLAISTLNSRSRYRRKIDRTITRQAYFQGYFHPEIDLPITNSDSSDVRKKNSASKIKLFFKLTEKEIKEFKGEVGKKINDNLTLEFIFSVDGTKINIVKQGGKGWDKSIPKILDFVSKRIGFNYIPAIRTEKNFSKIIYHEVSTALGELRHNKQYKELTDKLMKIETSSIKKINDEIASDLKDWLPNITDVQMEIDKNFYFNRLTGIQIYVTSNGTKTLLENKGDGVQSLFALALLAKNYSGEHTIIAIDEPEAHLHPEAVRKLQETISNLSNTTQVIIATHNPILVNRNVIDSNVIVNDGHVTKAKNIKKIRETLGVAVSDNLINAEKILAVEGVSDQKFFMKLFTDSGSQKIKNYLNRNLLVIEPLHGISRLENKIWRFQDMAATFFVIADHDKAAEEAIKKANNQKLLTIENYTYIPYQHFQNEAELEDLYSNETIATVYKKMFHIDILDDLTHQNKSLKWSNRMKNICCKKGVDWSEIESEIKAEIAEYISKQPNINSCLNEFGKNNINIIVEKVNSYFFDNEKTPANN